MNDGDYSELEPEEIEPDEPPSEKVGSFLETGNSVRIRQRPGGKKANYSIKSEQILNMERYQFLLLGFDTEYQSPPDPFSTDAIEAGKAKYEVVSYQFHAINYTGAEWSGIAIPDNGERLSFTDFIVYAISRGAALGQQVPKTIILVAHYNRADLPAFDDRKQLLWRLQNVRNSLISASAPVHVKVKFDGGGESELSVYVRDSILLAPAGRKSLAELGRLIDREKVRLAENDDEELEMKRNMKLLRSLDWDKFEAYALIDAEISAKYFLRLTNIYQTVTGERFVPSALSNIGMKLLIKGWMEHDPSLDPIVMVGKEAVDEAVWDERRQQFRRIRHKPYVEELSWFIDFVTECYHGGRNEQLWFGPSFEDDWYDYDLTSAYPTAMATIGEIDWRSIRPLTKIEDIKPSDLAFVCIDFKFPDGTRYPCLPVRTENGIIFPLSGRSYCVSPEIELALKMDCVLKLRHGVVVAQNESHKVFFSFIKESIRKRAEAPTKIENAFWKELTNSCYGKTAQGLREKRVFSLRKRRSERVSESAISNPVYAAYITSFVRAVVGEIMSRIPDNKMVFSVTTDGFITNANTEEMALAKSGPIAKKFSEARALLTGDPEVLSEKHRVRKLLGWRTRGQATLKPGEDVDTERFVLAKAGIKPPVEYTEVVEQNDYNTRLFFMRSAEHVIELDYHTSVREMIFWNADLVSKKAKKKISMEYDFKRKPRAVGMSEVENQAQISTGMTEHLVFSTEPWRSATEFRQVRAVWNAFYRNSKICLKTVDDFAEFANYFDMVTSLAPTSVRYLRSENGDLKRLKRDLCRAFKRGLAGFGNHQSMTSKEFAEALNEAGFLDRGVKVTTFDVNNAAKPSAPFQPRTTPPTKNVREMIGALKHKFPSLDEMEILSAPAPESLKLVPILSETCEFVCKAIESSSLG